MKTRRWLLLALALAACHAKPDTSTQVAALDDELTGANANSPAKDPALTAALHDQIMVDPGLVQQANRDALKPPRRPLSGALPADDIAARPGPAETEALRSAPPAGECRQCAAARRVLTLGALADARGSAGGQCTAALAYSAGWATRLPASVPLYPDARVSEAAGADAKGCALRVVSFTSSASPQRLLDWYYTRTSGAGFSAEHGVDGHDQLLAGTKAGGAFLVIVHPRGTGAEVDLMADAG